MKIYNERASKRFEQTNEQRYKTDKFSAISTRENYDDDYDSTTTNYPSQKEGTRNSVCIARFSIFIKFCKTREDSFFFSHTHTHTCFIFHFIYRMFTFSIILLLFTTTIDLNHLLFKTEYFSPLVGFLFEVFSRKQPTTFSLDSWDGWMGLLFSFIFFSTDGNRIRFFCFIFFF